MNADSTEKLKMSNSEPTNVIQPKIIS